MYADMPILSIVVLTYNRQSYLLKLLDFLNEEYSDLINKDKVEIIISDNCSTDNTEYITKEFLKQRDELLQWKYYKNERNVGLIGNIINTLEIATGDYIWWLGDDDHYKPGIVRNVLSQLEYRPDYLFLNHSQSTIEPWDGAHLASAIGQVDKDNETISIEDLIETYPGFIMFISASIYKRDILLELQKHKFEINLALPFYFSIYCAKSGNYIIDSNIWVDDNLINQASWKPESYKVFLYYLPAYIAQMPQLGYDKAKSEHIYKKLYRHLALRRIKANTVKFMIRIHCSYLLNLARKLKNYLYRD